MKSYKSVTLFLIIALICFFGLYETYLRPGWVDASIYIGHAINPDIYKTFSFIAQDYHGSRLGYILPQYLLLKILGDISGREIYVLMLYLGYFFSVIVLTDFFIKKKVERDLLRILFIFNPVFMTSLFYGGADGPASTQLLVSISLLVYAAKNNSHFRKKLLIFFSGFFLILSISSHIVVLVPALLILPSLFYILKIKKVAVLMIIGGFSAMVICNLYGYKFGLDKFYLSYSIPFAKHSLSGEMGENYIKPFSYWLKYFIFWVPVVISILFFFILNRNFFSYRDKQFSLQIASLLNLVSPITLYTLYDIFTRGHTLTSPAYYNLVFPSFLVGLVLMFSLNHEQIYTYSRNNINYIYFKRIALIFIIFSSVISTFSNEYSRGIYSYNSIKSREFYHSEISFMDRFKSLGLNSKNLQFVYLSKGVIGKYDNRVYKDFFMGSERYFDYLDSLTSLFLWDRSIAMRLNPDIKFNKNNLQLKENNIPIIFLGRNKAEVQNLLVPLARYLVGRNAGSYECFDRNSYSWCFILYR